MALEVLLLAALVARPAAADPEDAAHCVATYLPEAMGRGLGIDLDAWKSACEKAPTRSAALSAAKAAVKSPEPPPQWPAPAVLEPFTSKDGKTVNLCDAALMKRADLPRSWFAVEPRAVCAPPPGDKVLGYALALVTPGVPGGTVGGPGLRRALGTIAFEDAGFRARLRRYYERVRAVDAAAIAPKPGWAWALADEAADHEGVLAMRLIGFCGRDDAEPGPLRERRSEPEMKRLYETEEARLKALIAAYEEKPRRAPPDDPLASGSDALQFNDERAAHARLSALRPADYAEFRENICPSSDSPFYRTDALGTGLTAPESWRRAVTGGVLACEAARAGAPLEVAAALPANAAWADRLLRLAREAKELEPRRAALARAYQEYRKRPPLGERPVSEYRFLQRRAALDALDPAESAEATPERVDALWLLQSWKPLRPFPGPVPPPLPEGWSYDRYAAGLKRLDALGVQWRSAVEDYAAGARFGARRCSLIVDKKAKADDDAKER